MIKVFIIDNELLSRISIKKILKKSSDMIIVGEAKNFIEAYEEFKKVGLPDVFILDIDKITLDGLEFIKKVKDQKQIPIIVCTNETTSSKKSIDSIRYGAYDIIIKPDDGFHNNIEKISDEFISKIKSAVGAKTIKNNNIISKTKNKAKQKNNKIIGIGSSTGGVQTLEEIFVNLNQNHPPIVVVQHMPAGFTTSFAVSLNNLCKNSIVKEASDGDILSYGNILIAPGDRHMEIVHEGMFKFKVVLNDNPKVSSHRPSADVLFNSLAKDVKQNTIAFILTGMGKDGAVGIKKIRDVGGKTYGQNEKTCVVYGMPKVAFEIGGIEQQVSLNQIATIINNIN